MINKFNKLNPCETRRKTLYFHHHVEHTYHILFSGACFNCKRSCFAQNSCVTPACVAALVRRLYPPPHTSINALHRMSVTRVLYLSRMNQQNLADELKKLGNVYEPNH